MRAFLSGQKKTGRRVVFVPTMGALHGGHRSCVETGRVVDGGLLVLSIFVNPTQFGPGEDLEKYPRALDEDLELCKVWGCDAVFVPDTRAMYPAEQKTWVTVEGISDPLCGRARPAHFRGVATVVSKLFNIVEPDVAVFGQKDAQQALLLREMTKQLNFPVELILAPTAREKSGLALSSRNRYLTDSERHKAARIFCALRGAGARLREGERDPIALVAQVERDLEAGGLDDLEYVSVLNASDLSSLDRIEGKVILAVAARVGSTRLIDNIVFCVGDKGEVEEAPLF